MQKNEEVVSKVKFKDVINFKRSKVNYNFYRFISDNSIRRETKLALEYIVKKIKVLLARKHVN